MEYSLGAKDGWEVGIAVAVAVGCALSAEGLCRFTVARPNKTMTLSTMPAHTVATTVLSRLRQKPATPLRGSVTL